VVEQRGFAGAEEAGQNRDGKAAVGRLHHRGRSLSM
jgi:hypothetical protein